MKESRLFVTLVTPSPVSFIFSCVFAALTLLAASWSSLHSQPFVGPYLSGEYGFTSLLHDLSTTLNGVFNSNLAYNIVVVCFAALVGLCVYVVAESVRHMIAEAHATLAEVEYASDSTSKQALERTISLRLGLRCLSGLVWLGYTIFFFNGIVPYCASFIAKDASDYATLAAVRNLLAFVLLLMTTHLHVIFLRLIALRPRLISNPDFIGRGGHDLDL